MIITNLHYRCCRRHRRLHRHQRYRYIWRICVNFFFLIQLHVLGFNWYTYKVSRTCLFFLFTLGSFHYPVGGGLLLPKSRRVLHPKVLIQLIDNQIMYRALTCKNLGQLPLGKYVSQM